MRITSAVTSIAVAGVVLASAAGTIAAKEGHAANRHQHLDHVFVIMMENHSYEQIVNNPDAPFINALARTANVATNYFGVAHPSLTNYLEVVGGSNFGVLNDNGPDWGNPSCTTNLASGITSTDNPPSPPICPIAGTGMDAPTPQIDYTNEAWSGPMVNIDGAAPEIPAAGTEGKTIADQLVEHGLSWKSYQENLPAGGAYGVNYSDGFFTDSSDIPATLPGETQTLIDLYAAKHNPFVYFQNVQEALAQHTLENIVGFRGPHGLFDDLASGDLPNFSLIAPNQCNDQHGRGNAGPQCDYDPSDDGTQAGLNPALIYQGDQALRTIVGAIYNSPAWSHGHNAIVILWDENDYSAQPNTNHVLVIVDTNRGPHGVSSGEFFTHFSLLKTLDEGFGLPCLNHACDSNVNTMAGLF
ncbi:MAG TPA: alkaline phosphatase family protein [Candidatus Polarisedimenticolia bacterium]|nr:alkaline phosphatase family protein [Candidatus Polarisedimenticolia bacterium]